MRPGRAVASFDSATAMLRSLSRYLAGRDTPLLGQAPAALEPVLAGVLGAVNRLPPHLAERVYASSGIAEAVDADRVGEIRTDELANWVVDHYPRRRYPVIFIGSSNGALVHLAAALGAPWLPQTLLIPVRRRGVDRDDAEGELRAGRRPGEALLSANPDVVLHHMHDPNQDRLMIAGMSYFRMKWRRLPPAYRAFLRECLAPGGVVISVECELRWPATRVADRHLYQFGALGDASTDEYVNGGARVAEFLSRYGASRRAWSPPWSDVDSAEAEWGFDTALLEDIAESVSGWRRLRFTQPEHLSQPVAELYRQWYARRGLETNRLLAETFLLLEPWWALRTGSVPFWMVFNTRSSLRTLNRYLDHSGPYDEIRLMLFSHGTESIGLADADQWQQAVDRARKVGTLVGADPRAYPRDFATLARAHRELTRVRNLLPLPSPSPLPWPEAEPLLRGHRDLRWD